LEKCEIDGEKEIVVTMENSQNYSTDNRIYKFSQDGNACIIKEPRTPRYWYNYLWNENRYCAQVSQIGHGCSYYLSENADMCIHGTHSDTPVRLLKEIYGKPFQAAIAESGLKGIMPSYNSINGEPMSASYTLLKTFLRDEMGFEGLCVSDYGAVSGVHHVQHAGESEADAGLLCMEAGMDIEMPSTTGYGEELKRKFESGEIDMELLDKAVLRDLTAKFRMGLFENPYALAGEELKEAVCQGKDREVSLQSAKESLVLLKNNGVLPLKGDKKKIALIGPHADCARKFFGGYTHMCMMESTYAIANSIAGVSGVVQADADKIKTIPGTNIQSDETEEFDAILHRQKPECRSLLEEMRSRMPETEIRYAYGYPIAGADESRFEEALLAVKEADVVILTIGGKHGTCSMASMGEGVDACNINLPPCQEAFIRKAAEFGKPLIGVHFDGSVTEMSFTINARLMQGSCKVDARLA